MIPELCKGQLIREEQLPQAARQLRAMSELRAAFIPELCEEQLISEEQLLQAAGQLRAHDKLRAERMAYAESAANNKYVVAHTPLFLHKSHFRFQMCCMRLLHAPCQLPGSCLQALLQIQTFCCQAPVATCLHNAG